jgi:hypothetical protein
MLKRTALMESISSNLHSFLKKTGKNLSLKISSGQPYRFDKSRAACSLQDGPTQRTRFISRLDRLDQHLVKDICYDEAYAKTPKFEKNSLDTKLEM